MLWTDKRLPKIRAIYCGQVQGVLWLALPEASSSQTGTAQNGSPWPKWLWDLHLHSDAPVKRHSIFTYFWHALDHHSTQGAWISGEHGYLWHVFLGWSGHKSLIYKGDWGQWSWTLWEVFQPDQKENQGVEQVQNKGPWATQSGCSVTLPMADQLSALTMFHGWQPPAISCHLLISHG